MTDKNSSPLAAIKNTIQSDPTSFLLLFVLLLFSTKTLALVPFFILSLLCIYNLFYKQRSSLQESFLVFILMLFFCLWFPILSSLPDASAFKETLRITFSYFIFLFFTLYMIIYMEPVQTRKLMFFISVVLLFWCVDGMIQFIFGKNLFGYPYTPPQLKGMFYPKVRLPYILAILAPLFFEWLRLNSFKYKWTFILLILFVMVLLLGGKRVAWLMFLGSTFIYFIYLFLVTKKLSFRKHIPSAALLLFVTILLVANHPPLKNRIISTAGIFSGDAVLIEQATAHRLSLWEVSYDIFLNNPVNGVGPRGFREAFVEYAQPENFWVQNGRSGTTHPHMMLAEVAAETGIIGLIGLALFYFLVIKRIRFLYKNSSFNIIPWYLCVLVAFFPLNSHLAFYGSYWSSFCWWVLATTLAVDHAKTERQDTDH